ncbi:MAG: hypothetical protein R3D67_12830 [Hyphomicrobiaceae bacterium]
MRFETFFSEFGQFARHVGHTIAGVLLSPSSDLSLASLAVALVIAAVWLSRRHVVTGRHLQLKALVRLMFPRRWLLARSAGLDLKLLVLNLFVFGTLLAGAVISHRVISGGMRGLLEAGLGQPGPAPLPDLAATAILTVALFLAYELAYWVYHYLSHTVPMLWKCTRCITRQRC